MTRAGIVNVTVSSGIGIGVFWFAWGKFGFGWGILYGIFYQVWFGYRLAEWLLG